MTTTKQKPLSIVAAIQSLNTKFKEGNTQLDKHKAVSKKQSTFNLGTCFDICVHLEVNTQQSDMDDLTDLYTSIVGKAPTPKKTKTAMVLTCVFDGLSDSQKHAYKAVIDFAMANNVGLGGFVQFVEAHNGLEATRKAKYAADRAKNPSPSYQTRGEQAKAAISLKKKSIMPTELRKQMLSSLKAGQKALLYVTVNDDGTATYNEVITSETAINAAEQAYYKANKESLKAQNNISKQVLSKDGGVSAFEYFEVPEFDINSYNASNDSVKATLDPQAELQAA
jgi:hypothetical protein